MNSSTCNDFLSPPFLEPFARYVQPVSRQHHFRFPQLSLICLVEEHHRGSPSLEYLLRQPLSITATWSGPTAVGHSYCVSKSTRVSTPPGFCRKEYRHFYACESLICLDLKLLQHWSSCWDDEDLHLWCKRCSVIHPSCFGSNKLDLTDNKIGCRRLYWIHVSRIASFRRILSCEQG